MDGRCWPPLWGALSHPSPAAGRSSRGQGQASNERARRVGRHCRPHGSVRLHTLGAVPRSSFPPDHAAAGRAASPLHTARRRGRFWPPI